MTQNINKIKNNVKKLLILESKGIKYLSKFIKFDFSKAYLCSSNTTPVINYLYISYKYKNKSEITEKDFGILNRFQSSVVDIPSLASNFISKFNANLIKSTKYSYAIRIIKYYNELEDLSSCIMLNPKTIIKLK